MCERWAHSPHCVLSLFLMQFICRDYFASNLCKRKHPDVHNALAFEICKPSETLGQKELHNTMMPMPSKQSEMMMFLQLDVFFLASLCLVSSIWVWIGCAVHMTIQSHFIWNCRMGLKVDAENWCHLTNVHDLRIYNWETMENSDYPNFVIQPKAIFCNIIFLLFRNCA